MVRKKGFYSVALHFYISADMKTSLDKIQNASAFIRTAIEEKMRRDENVGEIKEVVND